MPSSKRYFTARVKEFLVDVFGNAQGEVIGDIELMLAFEDQEGDAAGDVLAGHRVLTADLE